jgi:lysophospholipase L1-like esterase
VKSQKIIVNILLLIITLFALLLLAEGITRIVMPNSVKLRLMHQPDKKLGYRLVPQFEMDHQTREFRSHIKINSEGLRDHEYPAVKDAKTFRILAIGDSFTLGLGVNSEESYPKVLETMLNGDSVNAGSKKYEVINAGVDGYGTDQEYLYLQELLQRYKPDMVIVGLYSNDVDDVIKGIPLALFKTKSKNHFYFLSYLRGLEILFYQTFKKDVNKELFAIYQDPPSAEFAHALQLTKQYLVRIRDLAQSTEAKTLIVIIPSCFEISKSEWEKKGLGHAYTDGFFNNNMKKFSDIFTEFGKTEKIPTLPLLPDFRSSKNSQLYFRVDPHWTKDGHRLAAGSIYNFIKIRSQ